MVAGKMDRKCCFASSTPSPMPMPMPTQETVSGVASLLLRQGGMPWMRWLRGC